MVSICGSAKELFFTTGLFQALFHYIFASIGVNLI